MTLALLFAATSALAENCALPSQGDGRVAAVIDARTLRLDDGRDIRLAGLAPLPPDHAARATAALTARLVGQRVTLEAATDMPDRYGRQAMLVRRDGVTASLQAELLTQGEALADQTMSVCTQAFRLAEADARRARRAIWSDRLVIKNAESPDDIMTAIGRFGIVEGRVVSVRQSGSVTYVNFGRRWTQDFAVTMPVKLLPSFEAAGVAPKSFAGQRLRIRGFIERRGGSAGHPGIEVVRPAQIEIVGANEVAGSSE